MKINNCPTCGNILERYVSQDAVWYHCPICNWEYIEDVIDKPWKDQRIYTLILIPRNCINKSTLKSISRVFECNYIQAKKILETNSDIIICTGNATNIKTMRDVLKEGEVLYRIEPQFPW